MESGNVSLVCQILIDQRHEVMAEGKTNQCSPFQWIEDTTYPGCYYHMVGNVQEWLNPPLITDVEYRTIDRYQGRPVYVKEISTQIVDASSTELATGISNGQYLVRVESGQNRVTFNPSWYSNSFTGSYNERINYATTSAFRYYSQHNSGNRLYVRYYYTKTTD